MCGLFEDEVSDLRFEIPIDDRERSQIERGVRTHQHADPARDREDRSLREPDNGGLFGAGEPLDSVVVVSKQRGGEQHDRCFCAHFIEATCVQFDRKQNLMCGYGPVRTMRPLRRWLRAALHLMTTPQG